MKNEKLKFFDDLAMQWEAMFYRDGRQAAELDALVRTYGIVPGSWVLDAGCGTGVVLERLSAAVGASGRVVGCDFSLPMLVCARQKNKPNCRFLCSDAQAVGVKSGSFTHVVYFSCFPHFDDKEQALREAFRLLKPGGSLIISHLLSSEEIAAVHHRCAQAVCSDVLPTRQWFSAMLEAIGFRLNAFTDRPGLFHLAAVKK